MCRSCMSAGLGGEQAYVPGRIHKDVTACFLFGIKEGECLDLHGIFLYSPRAMNLCQLTVSNRTAIAKWTEQPPVEGMEVVYLPPL